MSKPTHLIGVFVLVLALLATLGAALSEPAAAAAPANDAFAAASELSGPTASASGTNKDATKEAGEPNHAGNTGGASVWYRWTAPETSRVLVSTCGFETTFDTLLAVYTGTAVNALVEADSNDDACGLQSTVAFAATQGVTYRIAVDGRNGAAGPFQLQLRLTPSNDDFADAVELVGDEGSIAGTTVGASSEPGEPGFLGNSVWYRWTAPSSGTATFTTCGGSLDTRVAAYTGSAVDQLTWVASDDDSCGFSSIVSFQAAVGVTYRVAVESWGEGAFELGWNRNPPPPVPPFAWDDPSISGLPREGETLIGFEGEWAGTVPISFAYSWGRCDTGLINCSLIPGANAKTYVPTRQDVGSRLYLLVTASNAAGSSSAASNATAPIRSRGPANTTPPEVRGVARVGEILTAWPGAWFPPQPIQYTYLWQTCDADMTACHDLPSEASPIIQVRSGDVGHRLRVVVTGITVDGAVGAVSQPSAVVARARQAARARCVVPKVRGNSLLRARARIRRAGCSVGKVRRAYSSSIRRGRVISQKPRPGARLRRGAKINLMVSKGSKR